jgi:hypothetical protein
MFIVYVSLSGQDSILRLLAYLGIGNEADAIGISITDSSSQSGTGVFWYWTGSPYSGTRLSVIGTLFIPVMD